MITTVCPGCGLVLPKDEEAPDTKFHASRECWKLFCDLSGLTAQVYDEAFIHQTAIDTYESQHAGGETKNITAAFGLIGLYLVLEQGYNGRQVQKAHIILAKHTKVWPRLEPPGDHWDMTVADVLPAKSDEERKEKILAWARVTWDGWESVHQTIRDLVKMKLNPYR